MIPPSEPLEPAYPRAASKKPEAKPLPTIWNVPDPLWELIEKVQAFDGIIFRMRIGNQWNHLPKEFGGDSSVYRAFVRWERKAIFDILWAILLTRYDDPQGENWWWQSSDGCLGKMRGVPESGIGKTRPGQASVRSALVPPLVRT